MNNRLPDSYPNETSESPTFPSVPLSVKYLCDDDNAGALVVHLVHGLHLLGDLVQILSLRLGTSSQHIDKSGHMSHAGQVLLPWQPGTDEILYDAMALS